MTDNREQRAQAELEAQMADDQFVPTRRNIIDAMLSFSDAERSAQSEPAADTVAFVQHWMASGDHGPDQWHRDFAAAIDARAAQQGAPASDVLREALDDLQSAEAAYRKAHDLHGDADRYVGRMWDLMRRAGDKARAALTTSAPQRDAITDTDRLDFLDRCNQRLNERYGTDYRWELILNHNVNRLMLGGHLVVDLNDMAPRSQGFPSCREAIDAKLRQARSAALSQPSAPSQGEEGRP